MTETRSIACPLERVSDFSFKVPASVVSELAGNTAADRKGSKSIGGSGYAAGANSAVAALGLIGEAVVAQVIQPDVVPEISIGAFDDGVDLRVASAATGSIMGFDVKTTTSPGGKPLYFVYGKSGAVSKWKRPKVFPDGIIWVSPEQRIKSFEDLTSATLVLRSWNLFEFDTFFDCHRCRDIIPEADKSNRSSGHLCSAHDEFDWSRCRLPGQPGINIFPKKLHDINSLLSQIVPGKILR